MAAGAALSAEVGLEDVRREIETVQRMWLDIGGRYANERYRFRVRATDRIISRVVASLLAEHGDVRRLAECTAGILDWREWPMDLNEEKMLGFHWVERSSAVVVSYGRSKGASDA